MCSKCIYMYMLLLISITPFYLNCRTVFHLFHLQIYASVVNGIDNWLRWRTLGEMVEMLGANGCTTFILAFISARMKGYDYYVMFKLCLYSQYSVTRLSIQFSVTILLLMKGHRISLQRSNNVFFFCCIFKANCQQLWCKIGCFLEVKSQVCHNKTFFLANLMPWPVGLKF